MKTRFFPLITLCGMVASSGLVARAIEANPTQPGDTTTSAVPVSAAPKFSGRINEVVSLSKSGVDESIVLAFIKNSPGPFEPSADEIIKLRDMGVSTPVLTAMLQRGSELREQAHSAAMAAAPDQANTNPSQAPVITETPPSTYAGGDNSGYATQPASTVTYIGGDYGSPYYYPSTYYYSGYYSSPIFYPFPCWFGGVFYAHGCFFPHGCFVHDNFHVHDGFHAGFHGNNFHAGFHADGHGGIQSSASGFHAGPSGFHAGSSGFHTGVTGGVHSGAAGNFHAGVSTGFHSGMTAGAGGFHTGVSGFHSAPVAGFHGGTVGGNFRGGSVGGFHGSAVGGAFHGGMASGGFHGGMGGGGGFHMGGGGGGGFHGGGHR